MCVTKRRAKPENVSILQPVYNIQWRNQDHAMGGRGLKYELNN